MVKRVLGSHTPLRAAQQYLEQLAEEHSDYAFGVTHSSNYGGILQQGILDRLMKRGKAVAEIYFEKDEPGSFNLGFRVYSPDIEPELEEIAEKLEDGFDIDDVVLIREYSD